MQHVKLEEQLKQSNSKVRREQLSDRTFFCTHLCQHIKEMVAKIVVGRSKGESNRSFKNE
jgi:Trm5-related predicted tRNA methylase